jgi:hypothetical protein
MRGQLADPPMKTPTPRGRRYAAWLPFAAAICVPLDAREAGFDHHLAKPVDDDPPSALPAGETARAVTSAPGHA